MENTFKVKFIDSDYTVTIESVTQCEDKPGTSHVKCTVDGNEYEFEAVNSLCEDRARLAECAASTYAVMSWNPPTEFKVNVGGKEYIVKIDPYDVTDGGTTTDGDNLAHVKCTVNGTPYEFYMAQSEISEPYDVAQAAAYSWHFEH